MVRLVDSDKKRSIVVKIVDRLKTTDIIVVPIFIFVLALLFQTIIYKFSLSVDYGVLNYVVVAGCAIFGGIQFLINRKPNSLINISPFLRRTSEMLFLLFIVFVNFNFLYCKWAGVDRSIPSFYYATMANYLPFSDAAGFSNATFGLLDDGTLSSWALSVRTMIAYSLSSLMLVCKSNIHAVLASLSFLASMGIFVLYKQIAKSTHYWLGIATVIICVFQYVQYAGLFSGENIGFIFSIYAGCLLVRGYFDRSMRAVWWAMTFIALSFSLRAGMYFIVPFLLLAFTYLFRTKRQIFNFRFLIIGLAAFVFFSAIGSVFERLSNPSHETVPQANFAYVLYSMSQGKVKDWKLVFTDHPEILEMSVDQRPAYIYGKALRSIKESPLVLIEGYWNFVKTRNLSVLAKIISINVWDKIEVFIRVFFLMSFFILPVFLIYKQKRSTAWLVLALIAGSILSLPFLQVGGSRVYAASHVYITLIPIFLYGGLLEDRVVKRQYWATGLSPLYGGILMTAALILPMYIICRGKLKTTKIVDESSFQCDKSLHLYEMKDNFIVLSDEFDLANNYIDRRTFKSNSKNINAGKFNNLHYQGDGSVKWGAHLIIENMESYKSGKIAVLCVDEIGGAKTFTEKQKASKVYKGTILEVFDKQRGVRYQFDE